jgi:myxalamid-type polyketide synthase MxaE and MxaD
METKIPEERLRRLLQDARDKLESERLRRSEAIAIVGIGCRFPGGGDGPRALWQLLERGVDATGPVPASRWDAEAIYDPDPDAPGKSYARRGGFLGDVDGFDAAFFGISPREARGLDPQQRLLLETSWEALEDAGVSRERLSGSATGVWVGFSLDDYAKRNSGDPHAALGNARSVAAGRIAYVFGLHGPALQVDTSCSSSLVATHLACQSLRTGECDLALVAGVNLLLSAESSIALCKLRALSADGRCKTFDAAADGYARGEGCGVVVLERLSDVRHGRQRVYAVIRGSAVNHDGRSNGLTAPNGAAQEEVIRQALVRAQIEPDGVDYVEAHGTGTPLGDPIEALALSRVYSKGRAVDAPLAIGSIKTNIGHLEGAAGVAGLIKAALCLEQRRIAPHLHVQAPNPRIPWQSLPLRIATELCEWPDVKRPRRAGVSAFGISGTNAHLILEEAPERPQPPALPARSAELVVLSAHSAAALRGAATRLHAALLERAPGSLRDLAHALLAQRGAFEHRAAFATPSLSALGESLASYIEAPPAVRERTSSGPGKVAFVFPGQGSQWLGMGRQLLAEEPVFREQLEPVDSAIQQELGWSVASELMADEAVSRLQCVDVVQPILFAFQVALAGTLQAWGVKPDAVIGHSMGEVAAAHIAGALSLRDAVAIVCRRSRLLRRISGAGAMALVELSVDEARAAIRGFESRLSIAVNNGSRSTVLSGDPEPLAEVARSLGERDVFVRHVKVDVASHSPQVEPLLPELMTELRDLRPTDARLPMLSTVTGLELRGPELDARYWADNLRQPVQFARAVSRLIERGVTSFVEVSAHPLLTSAVERLLDEAGVTGAALASLHRERPERQTLLDALGALFVQGHPLSVERLFPAASVHVELPRYAWQRESYWIGATANAGEAGAPTGHPLLGGRIRSARGDLTYEAVIASNAPSWLVDHVVLDEVFFPAAGFLEVMGAAVRLGAGAPLAVESLTIEVPLVLASAEPRRIQTSIDAERRRVSVYSQAVTASIDDDWTLHATAELGTFADPPALDLVAIRERCSRAADVDQLYAGFSAVGLHYGACFRNLRRVWRGAGEVLAEVSLPSDLAVERYAIHPALLDAALQAAGALLPEAGAQLMLPAHLTHFVVQRPGQSRAWVYLRALGDPGASGAYEVRLLTDGGEHIAGLGRLELRPARMLPLPSATAAGQPMLYRASWVSAEALATPEPSSRTWLVVDTSLAAPSVVTELSRRGHHAALVGLDELPERAAGAQVLCYWDAAAGGEEAIRQVTLGLAIVKALVDGAAPARLWWCTDGAVSVVDGDAVNPSGAAIAGLGRTAHQEHPELRCTLVDAHPRDVVEALLHELSVSTSEQQVAFRNGQRHALRLTAIPATAAHLAAPRADMLREGTWLVTGGLGGLGFEAARYLAERGAAHLLLLGRRGLETPGAREVVSELESMGSRVSVAAVDVADRAALDRVVQAIPNQYPLRGIVHAAGVLDDGIIVQQTPERLLRVMAPKVLGAWNLHRLSESLQLEQFVSFSSLAGTLGSPGQAGYSAANCFLDGLAAARQKAGLAGQSIAWGPWSGKGLLTTLGESQIARMRQRGVEVLSVAEGIELFARALTLPDANLLAANLDLPRLLGNANSTAASPLAAPGGGVTANEWIRSLEAIPEAERASTLRGWVRSAAARVLLVRDASTLSEHPPLRDFGLDSLMGLQLRQLLEKALGLRLSPNPSMAQLSIHDLTEQLIGALSNSARRFQASAASAASAAPGTTSTVPSAALAAPFPAHGSVAPPRSAGADGVSRDAVAGRSARIADWLCLHAVESPKVRLFCFHESGGSSSMFLPFGELKQHGIEVHAIEHRRDVHVSRVPAAQYLDDTVEYLARFGDRPQVLFGHSGGAIAAWRVLLELRERGARLPMLLVSSAPPVAPDERSSCANVDDVVAAVARKGWLKSDAARAALRERFSADVDLLLALPALPFAPVEVPVACFVGQDDSVVPESRVVPWQGSTLRDFSLSVLPGDHFYLGDARTRQLLFRELRERIERELDSLERATLEPRRVVSTRWV